jgi:hypothetical protein
MSPGPPFVFPRFKGEGRWGLTCDFPPALPRPGKNHPAVGLATLRNKSALCGARKE